jgi:LPXTG-site transpeptidase (sortase) family protein
MKSETLWAASLARMARMFWGSKKSFFGLFVCIFGVQVVTLAYFDLLPQHTSAVASSRVSQEEVPAVAEMPEDPLRLHIEKIGLDVVVANPVSTDIAVLDRELLKGAVRYPTSARLGEDGNVVLFGHSSYLPIVHNQAFKAFNGIQTLVPGDRITVESEGRTYEYRVLSVTEQKAESGVIPLAVTGRILTLATCDTFGAKSDRFVVTAELVESHALLS